MCGEDSFAGAGEVVVGLDILLKGLAAVRDTQCQQVLECWSHCATSRLGSDSDDEV